MEATTEEKRAQARRTLADRRRADRRAGGDRRQIAVAVETERRLEGRRFVERRAEVRRQLNEQRHLLT
jgi:hypothetical protein